MQVTFSGGDPSDFSASGAVTIGTPSVDEAAGAVVGLLTSTYATDLRDVTTTAVWRDGAGAVTRVAAGYVNAIQANGDTWFSMSINDTSIGVPAEIYLELSSSGYEPTPPAPELTITESWFLDVGDGSFAWGTIIDNGGETVWSGPLVEARFYDADNRLVTADQLYWSELRPGANGLSGSLYGVPSVPVRMETSIYDGGYEDDSPDEGNLTIDQLATVNDGSSATVTGQITSTFAEEQSFVQLVLVWRNADNTVAYSTSAYADTVPAGGSVPFETYLYGDNLPTTPPNEVYWSI
jgi:hypothetical protein